MPSGIVVLQIFAADGCGVWQEFTMAEIQYQVDEMLFKMNALSGLSSLPEKPPMYFTDSDTACGAGFTAADDGLSSGGSEVSLSHSSFNFIYLENQSLFCT